MAEKLRQIVFENQDFPDITSPDFKKIIQTLTIKNLAKAAGMDANDFKKAVKFCFRLSEKTDGKFGMETEQNEDIILSTMFNNMSDKIFDQIPDKYIATFLKNEAMSRCDWKDMLQLIRNILSFMESTPQQFPNFEACVRMFGHPDNDATTGFTYWIDEQIEKGTQFGLSIKDSYSKDRDDLPTLQKCFQHYINKVSLADRVEYEDKSLEKNQTNFPWSLFLLVPLADGNTIAYCVENMKMIPIPIFLFVAALDCLKLILLDADGGPIIKACKATLNEPPDSNETAFAIWIKWNTTVRKTLHKFITPRFARHYVHNETYIREFIEVLIEKYQELDVTILPSRNPKALLEYDGSLLNDEHKEIAKNKQAYEGYLAMWEKKITKKIKQQEEITNNTNRKSQGKKHQDKTKTTRKGRKNTSRSKSPSESSDSDPTTETDDNKKSEEQRNTKKTAKRKKKQTVHTSSSSASDTPKKREKPFPSRKTRRSKTESVSPSTSSTDTPKKQKPPTKKASRNNNPAVKKSESESSSSSPVAKHHRPKSNKSNSKYNISSEDDQKETCSD